MSSYKCVAVTLKTFICWEWTWLVVVWLFSSAFSFFFKLIFQWTEYISDECAVKLTVCFHAGKVSWLQQLLAILPHSIHHFVKVLMFCSEPPRKKKEEKRMTKQPNSFIPCQKTDWSLSLFALGTINVTFSWMPY